MRFAVCLLLCLLGGCANGHYPITKTWDVLQSEPTNLQVESSELRPSAVNRIKVFDPIVELVEHSLLDDPQQLAHWQGVISSAVTPLILDDLRESGFTVSHTHLEDSHAVTDKHLISQLIRNMYRIRTSPVSETGQQLIPTVAALSHRLSDGDVNGLLISKYSGWVKSQGLSIKERVTHALYKLVTFGFATAKPVADSNLDVVFYLIDARTGELLWTAEGASALASATQLTSELLGKLEGGVFGAGVVQEVELDRRLDRGLAQLDAGKPLSVIADRL